jgi:dihydroorotate dehydrogenase
MNAIYSRLLRPALRRVPPELGHKLAIEALKLGAVPADPSEDDPVLRCRVFGLDFRNPIGLAAGFDKDAEVIDPALGLGFGFVEAGTVTPKPQPGNPRPRLFRLDEDEAVINRYGFNSAGLEAFVERLARRSGRGVVGANVGHNKDSIDRVADFSAGVAAVAPHADYIVVNVSSPNTPGLRELQARQAMGSLLAAVMAARARGQAGRKPPLLVKVAPDLSRDEASDIVEAALAAGVDGLIVGNTTVSRPPDLSSPCRDEAGGLSGRPLMRRSTECLATFYALTRGRLPLIGCGGVASGADAYAKIRAGAALVQLYTAMVFRGPGLVGDVKRELAALLRRDGFACIGDAVGAAHR